MKILLVFVVQLKGQYNSQQMFVGTCYSKKTSCLVNPQFVERRGLSLSTYFTSFSFSGGNVLYINLPQSQGTTLTESESWNILSSAILPTGNLDQVLLTGLPKWYV